LLSLPAALRRRILKLVLELVLELGIVIWGGPKQLPSPAVELEDELGSQEATQPNSLEALASSARFDSNKLHAISEVGH
jgi:hypothetical protein